MDWKEMLKFTGSAHGAVTRMAQWEVNEIVNGDGMTNSPEATRLRTAICGIVAYSLGRPRTAAILLSDLPKAKAMMETLLAMLREGKEIKERNMAELEAVQI